MLVQHEPRYADFQPPSYSLNFVIGIRQHSDSQQVIESIRTCSNFYPTAVGPTRRQSKAYSWHGLAFSTLTTSRKHILGQVFTSVSSSISDVWPWVAAALTLRSVCSQAARLLDAIERRTHSEKFKAVPPPVTEHK